MSHFLGICSLSLVLVFTLTACQPASSSGEGGTGTTPAFVAMDPTQALNLVNTVSPFCSASGSGQQMGAAPGTISVGTGINTQEQKTYTLSGGSTTITQVFGNVWIVGTGQVTVNGIIAGNVAVCGPSVAFVSNNQPQANVVVLNGNVGDVTNFRGNLAIDGGSITGNVTGSSANVVFRTGGVVTGRTYTGQ